MTAPHEIPFEISAAINVLEKHVRGCDPECVAAFQHVYQFLLGRLDALRAATLLHEQGERELRDARKAHFDAHEQGERERAELRATVKTAEALVDELKRERDGWMESAAQFARNQDFYRGIVVQIGEPFGPDAYTSDDGSVQQDVLALKVPELVAALRTEHAAALGVAEALRIELEQARAEIRRLARNNPSSAD